MTRIDKPPVKFELSRVGIRNFVRLVYELETDRQFEKLEEKHQDNLFEMAIGAVAEASVDWMVQTCSANRHKQNQRIGDIVRDVVKKWLVPPEPTVEPVPMAVPKRGPGRPRKDQQPQVSEN